MLRCRCDDLASAVRFAVLINAASRAKFQKWCDDNKWDIYCHSVEGIGRGCTIDSRPDGTYVVEEADWGALEAGMKAVLDVIGEGDEDAVDAAVDAAPLIMTWDVRSALLRRLDMTPPPPSKDMTPSEKVNLASKLLATRQTRLLRHTPCD